MRLRRMISSSLFLLVLLTFSAGAFAQIGIGISVGFGPPALPVYEQPLCPGDGYIWTPGYWAWDADGDDYYWVPGTWVMAPEVGYLWTPPWWGWEGDGFLFHEGFWGPQIGFYGGINYGFGYFGEGYAGGRWQDGRFFYNREVNNINVTNIRNVYNERVEVRNDSHVSYNGHGGVEARPTPQQEAAMRERHIGPVGPQAQHAQAARGNPELRASANHGRPPIAATERPGALREGAVPARAAGGTYNPPANRGARRAENGRPESGGNRGPGNEGARTSEPGARAGGNYVHPHDLPTAERPAAPNTGDPKRDRKLQQQQDKMYAQQNKEREKLQAQQEKEHQQLARQSANEQRKQQVEQRHQQQTQQLSQKHEQQQQRMQSRMAPAPAPKGNGGRPH